MNSTSSIYRVYSTSTPAYSSLTFQIWKRTPPSSSALAILLILMISATAAENSNTPLLPFFACHPPHWLLNPLNAICQEEVSTLEGSVGSVGSVGCSSSPPFTTVMLSSPTLVFIHQKSISASSLLPARTREQVVTPPLLSNPACFTAPFASFIFRQPL